MIVDGRADENTFLAGSRHRRQTGEHRADGPVILHRGHVVVDLVRDHLAVCVQSDFDIGECRGRLRGPLEVLRPHPLHAHRLAHGLRQNHRFVFGAGVPAVGSSIVARAGERAHDDVVRRRAEHLREFTAQRLGVLVVRVNVNRPVLASIGHGHGRSHGRVLHDTEADRWRRASSRPPPSPARRRLWICRSS